MHTHHHLFERHQHEYFPDDLDAFIRCAGRHGRHRDRQSDDGAGGRHGSHRGGRSGPGRVFGRGELKLVLLALIAEHPRHGYELIRTIEDMFDGNYAPSPGAIYPTLTMLEEMDYASVEAGDDGKKRYRITDAGKAYLEDNRVAVDAAMTRLQQSAKIYARMATPDVIREGVHNLRHALRSHPWPPTEARRVVAILERAAREIIDGAPGN